MKIKIVFFFTLVFTILIVAPTVFSLLDDKENVAFFLEINEEEEENKGKESTKDLEIKIYPSDNFSSLFLKGIQKNKNVSFTSKNYTSEYPKITTPPPEFLVKYIVY